MRARVTRANGPAGDVRFCLVFPREALSVPVMRHVLGDTLSRIGLDPESVSDLLLAVTEACTNVLRHSGPGLRYEVVARVGRKRCVLQVLDSGSGFDPAIVRSLRPYGRSSARYVLPPALAGAPSAARATRASAARYRPWPMRARAARAARGEDEAAVARLPESGRGLAIMRACVDDVTLRSRPGRGTVVSLRKRIELRSDAPLAREEPVRLRDAG